MVSKFVAKLIQYRILFEDTLTLLWLDYRYALLITMCLAVIGIRLKNPDYNYNYIIQQVIVKKVKKISMF